MAYLGRVKTEKIFGEITIYMHPTLNKSYTTGKHRPPSKLHTGLSCAGGLRAAEPLEASSVCALWGRTSMKSCLAPPTSAGWVSPQILKTQEDGCKNKKLQGFFRYPWIYDKTTPWQCDWLTEWLTEWVLSWKGMILESWTRAAGPKGEHTSHSWPLCCLGTIEQQVAWVPSEIPQTNNTIL